jgi:hypothetical protein
MQKKLAQTSFSGVPYLLICKRLLIISVIKEKGNGVEESLVG